MKPLVSVLLPVYAPAPWLQDAARSILSQDLSDCELILIDDGSEDPTPIRRVAQRDRRVRLIRHPTNRGIGEALNTGIAAARAPFIARMDADDLAAPDRLRRQVAVLETNPSLLCVGTSYLRIDPNGRVLQICRRGRDPVSTRWALLTRSAILHPTVMFRRTVFTNLGLSYRSLSLVQDLDLFLRIAEHGDLMVMPDVLLRYRVHPSSQTQAQRQKQIEQHVAILREFWERGSWLDAADRDLLSALVRAYLAGSTNSAYDARSQFHALTRLVETFVERHRPTIDTENRIRADAVTFLFVALLRSRSHFAAACHLARLLFRDQLRVLKDVGANIAAEILGLIEGRSTRAASSIFRTLP